LIQHAARLHPGIFFLGVDLNDLVEVLGEINDHGDVAGLSTEAGTAAARQQRRAMLASNSDGLNSFFNRFGNHYADRYLTVIRAINGVKSAGTVVKSDLAGDGGAQLGGKDINVVASFRAIPIRGLRRHLQIMTWRMCQHKSHSRRFALMNADQKIHHGDTETRRTQRKSQNQRLNTEE